MMTWLWSDIHPHRHHAPVITRSEPEPNWTWFSFYILGAPNSMMNRWPSVVLYFYTFSHNPLSHRTTPSFSSTAKSYSPTTSSFSPPSSGIHSPFRFVVSFHLQPSKSHVSPDMHNVPPCPLPPNNLYSGSDSSYPLSQLWINLTPPARPPPHPNWHGACNSRIYFLFDILLGQRRWIFSSISLTQPLTPSLTIQRPLPRAACGTNERMSENYV